jgi:hypothetical protein
MFEDKAANQNCTLLLSIEIVEVVGRGRGIRHPCLHSRRDMARIWGRGLVGSCGGLFGVREREARFPETGPRTKKQRRSSKHNLSPVLT